MIHELRQLVWHYGSNGITNLDSSMPLPTTGHLVRSRSHWFCPHEDCRQAQEHPCQNGLAPNGEPVLATYEGLNLDSLVEHLYVEHGEEVEGASLTLRNTAKNVFQKVMNDPL
jgi:hypothetical protein